MEALFQELQDAVSKIQLEKQDYESYIKKLENDIRKLKRDKQLLADALNKEITNRLLSEHEEEESGQLSRSEQGKKLQDYYFGKVSIQTLIAYGIIQ